MQTQEYLLKVIPTDWLWERPCVGDIIKQFATQDWLLDNVGHSYFLSIVLLIRGLFLELIVFHYVLVVEIGGGFNFLLDKGYSILIILWIVQLENFYCVPIAFLVLSKLHFGTDTRAKCLDHPILV